MLEILSGLIVIGLAYVALMLLSGLLGAAVGKAWVGLSRLF